MVPPTNLFELCGSVEAGQLRNTVDEFCRVLCEVDLRLTRDLQEAHIQRLYPAPISFCEKTYTSYVDAVRTIGLKLFEEAMLSLIRELDDGIYLLVPEVMKYPECVDIYADQMAVQWRRIGGVLGENKTDTALLAVLLKKEQLQVEKLVADSRVRTTPNAADSESAKGESNDPTHLHSSDFRSATWDGVDYEFTTNQAACVKVLWEAFEDGIGSMGEVEILDRAGLESDRLDNVFRIKIKGTSRNEPHNAWNHMIVKGGTSGTYRLNAESKLPRK